MTAGQSAWCAIGAFAVVYDVWAQLTDHDTLSSAFKANPATLIGLAYLNAHLTRALPPKYDPLRRWKTRYQP